MKLPGWNWDWDVEIEDAHRARREKEKIVGLLGSHEAQVPSSQPKKSASLYVKGDRLYIEARYFRELAKQMRHRVNIMVDTFPLVDGHYGISSSGYQVLQKYLPLPTWEDLTKE